MRIQLVTAKNTPPTHWAGVKVNRFHSPQSIDEFDLNVIDLSDSSLWYGDTDKMGNLNVANDFVSLRTMVASSSQAVVLYVMPQNIKYSYEKPFERYHHIMPIKDLADNILNHMLSYALFPTSAQNILQFENTRTLVDGTEYAADFFFKNVAESAVLTYSNRSKKPTTLAWKDKRIFVTTLNVVESAVQLIHYINNVICPPEHSDFPEWFTSIRFSDDAEQHQIIQDQMSLIEQAERTKRHAEEKLSQNDEYKSILYTNGDALVRVVYKILQQLLTCDLSTFVDEKREDFLIEKPEVTFIGEIKGVTSNVKNEHVSQCDLHYSQYIDRLTEQGNHAFVKQLLVMNPFRRTDPHSREPIHEFQINLAIRNNCLIIETATLLRVFENYLAGTITSEQCITVFKNNSGLLSLDMFQ